MAKSPSSTDTVQWPAGQPRLELITPAQAKDYLSRNIHNNRPLSKLRVERYARDMMCDRWQANGETLIFDDEGNLIDGQHRLHACVTANRPFYSFTIHGVPRSCLATIDIGKARNLADALKTSERLNKHRNEIASCLQLLFAYDHNLLGTKVMPTHAECLETLDRHPDISRCVEHITNLNRLRRIGTGTVNSFCYYLFSKQNAELANTFFEKLETGANLTANDPVYALRERMLRNRVEILKLDRLSMLALYIKAWNAAVEGKNVGLLIYRPKAEPFPLPGMKAKRVRKAK